MSLDFIDTHKGCNEYESAKVFKTHSYISKVNGIYGNYVLKEKEKL